MNENKKENKQEDDNCPIITYSFFDDCDFDTPPSPTTSKTVMHKTIGGKGVVARIEK